MDLVAIQTWSEPVRTRHWPFFDDSCNIRGQYREECTKRLYQWLSGWASFFRSNPPDRRTSRTIRTEVTVQRQGMTLLVGDAASFDTCPLCGSALAPEQAEQARLRLSKGSISA
jgi:hypothetical protein